MVRANLDLKYTRMRTWNNAVERLEVETAPDGFRSEMNRV